MRAGSIERDPLDNECPRYCGYAPICRRERGIVPQLLDDEEAAGAAPHDPRPHPGADSRRSRPGRRRSWSRPAPEPARRVSSSTATAICSCYERLEPEEILAFTFTDRAGAQLRERIRSELARAGSPRAEPRGGRGTAPGGSLDGLGAAPDHDDPRLLPQAARLPPGRRRASTPPSGCWTVPSRSGWPSGLRRSRWRSSSPTTTRRGRRRSPPTGSRACAARWSPPTRSCAAPARQSPSFPRRRNPTCSAPSPPGAGRGRRGRGGLRQGGPAGEDRGRRAPARRGAGGAAPLRRELLRLVLQLARRAAPEPYLRRSSAATAAVRPSRGRAARPTRTSRELLRIFGARFRRGQGGALGARLRGPPARRRPTCWRRAPRCGRPTPGASGTCSSTSSRTPTRCSWS